MSPPTTPTLSLGPSPPPIPACPADAPEWFQFAYEAISNETLGGTFNGLIEKLIALESAYGYKTGRVKGLSASQRLKAIRTWIGGGRGRRGGSGAHGPQLTPAAATAFGEEWWLWWKTLQPPFRQVMGLATHTWPRQDARRRAAEAPQWSSLLAPGPNGMFIVILGLYWWGRGLRVGGGRRTKLSAERAWVEAVNDVAWIIEGLIELKAKEESEKAQTELESDQLGSTD
ncbi:hypothetical protein FB451DRAFT_1020285 [Mycena latifolia]|nr:hypothetical protein FB451DRAFT_1020285 [Mycena latifolia]